MFYLLYLIVIFSYSFLKKLKNGRKKYCVLTGICYFVVAALRSNTVGFDTDIYVSAFNRLAEMPLDAAAVFADKDVFFWVLLSILGKITSNYTILFSIVAALFTISAWHLIYKYSRDPRLSIIVLLAFNLYQFTLTGMRQTIAISFILWAIDSCYERKVIRSIVFVLLGSIFHSSALAFLVVIGFLFYKKKLNQVSTLTMALLLGLAFLFRGYIAKGLIVLIQDRGYEVTILNGGLTMTFVIFSLFLMGGVFINEYTFSDKNANLTFFIASMACFFEMLVSTQSIFFRLAFYFLIIYVIFIPNIIETIQHNETKAIVKIGIYILLSIQYLFVTIGSCGVIPYQTFWQV